MKAKPNLVFVASLVIIGGLYGLVDVPRSGVVLSGYDAELTCSTTVPDDVNWVFVPFDSHRTVDVSRGTSIFDKSKHSLKGNPSAGEYHLVIKNVQQSDAGTYRCVDEGGIGDEVSAQLTVIDSTFEYSTNLSKDGVLGENNCGLEPDYIRFSCGIKFRGDVVPVLEWHDYDGNIIPCVPSAPHLDLVTCSLELKAELRLNGTRLKCLLVNAVSDKRETCSTSNINVLYLQNSTEVLRATNLEEKFVCSDVKSNPNCSYSWSSFNRSELVLGELDKPLMPAYNCTANCFIRGKHYTIVTKTLFVGVETHHQQSFTNEILLASLVCSIIFTIILIITAVVVFYMRHRRNKSGGARTSKPVDVRKNFRRLMKYNRQQLYNVIDTENGLIDCLLSNDVLTFNEHSKLTNKLLWATPEDQIEELLVRMILPKISLGVIEPFVEALVETGQEHIARLLDPARDTRHRILTEDELRCLDQGRFRLVDMLNTSDDMLCRLASAGCITERHVIRIKCLTSITDRNKELLAIMRRRSNVHLDLFKQYLADEKQITTVQYLTVSPDMNLPEMTEIMIYKVCLTFLNLWWRKPEKNEPDIRKAITEGGTAGYRGYIKTVMSRFYHKILQIFPTYWKRETSRHKIVIKRNLLRRVVRLHMRRCRPLLIDRLDTRHGLLESLLDKGVITLDEKTSIEERDHTLERDEFPRYPKKEWPRLRSEEQINRWNKKLLECLRNTSHDQFSNFLLALDENCQTHLVNYLTSKAEKLPVFKTDWPIPAKTKNVLIARSETLRGHVNPMLEVDKDAGKGKAGVWNTAEAWNSVSKKARSSVKTGMKWLNGKALTRIHKDGSSSTKLLIPEKTSEGNLFDILRTAKCMVTLASEPEKEGKCDDAERLIQLLKLGSIRTFETTKDYLRNTHQDLVAQSMEVTKARKIEIANEKWAEGVAWLDNKIFVVTWSCNQVFVYNDHEPFDQLESVKVPGLKYPWDLAASKSSKALIIIDCPSDKDGSLIKVNVAENTIKELSLKGQPNKGFINSKNELMTPVLRVDSNGLKRWHLDFYDVTNVSFLKSFPLPQEVKFPWHAIQTSLGKIVILFETAQQNWSISELSGTGDEILSLNPSLLDLKWPQHMSIDDCDRLLISDYDREEVIMVDFQKITSRVKFDSRKDNLIGPTRLCFVQEKQQLVVGGVGEIYVLDLEQEQEQDTDEDVDGVGELDSGLDKHDDVKLEIE